MSNLARYLGCWGQTAPEKPPPIRMILDIFKADSGEISVLDGPMTEEKKNNIGYLPEERGLYQDIPLERCLIFLAGLKGMEESVAAPKIEDYLKHFDLYDSRAKKVKELSKGMQQKAQLISTLVHDPELIFIDEPFTALDPVNTEMVKDMLENKRDEGKAIVMSTHQMNQVEELCDRILLIDSGNRILYGTLSEIQHHFSSHDILVTPLTPLPESIDGVTEIRKLNGRYRLVLSESAEPYQVLKGLINQGVKMNEFEIAVPPLNEIFIKVVKEQKGNNNG